MGAKVERMLQQSCEMFQHKLRKASRKEMKLCLNIVSVCCDINSSQLVEVCCNSKKTLSQHKKGKQHKSYVATLETYIATKNTKHAQEDN